jgi:hypothetical protein
VRPASSSTTIALKMGMPIYVKQFKIPDTYEEVKKKKTYPYSFQIYDPNGSNLEYLR